MDFLYNAALKCTACRTCCTVVNPFTKAKAFPCSLAGNGLLFLDYYSKVAPGSPSLKSHQKIQINGIKVQHVRSKHPVEGPWQGLD